MKKISMLFVRRVLIDQSGQTLPVAAAIMTALLGVGGLTIDAGHAYVYRGELQNSSNAAALAAAGVVYNTSSTDNAITFANNYASGSKTNQNYDPKLGTVNTSVIPKCLNVLMPPGTKCVQGTTPPNAVQVQQTGTIGTYFMALFGFKTLTITATATASMMGVAQPWNVAIIEDATGSMATADSNCGGISEFQCALNGIQALLAATNPCPPGSSTCTPATANFRVAQFTFPNIITADLPSANACSGQTYTTPLPYQVYTLPVPGLTGYTPLSYKENGTTWTASYEVTYGASDADANGFVSDYYQPTNTSKGGLNPNSSIVQAVGYGGSGSGNKAGCMTTAPGGIALNGATGTGNSNSTVNTVNVGEGITYYASAIYAAQSALVAERNAHPGSQNAIILLSDGQANTQWIYFPQGSLSQTPSANTSTPSTIATISASSGYDTLKSTPNKSAKVASALSTPNLEASGTISGLYPDFLDECQQAITAAQAATAAGTRVYAVAYGAEQTGCASGSKADDYTDVTLVATGANAPFTLSQLTPCVTMENIASSLEYFYSDYLQSGSSVSTSCVDNSHTVTSLPMIFQSIAATFTTPRLIPNSST